MKKAEFSIFLLLIVIFLNLLINTDKLFWILPSFPWFQYIVLPTQIDLDQVPQFSIVLVQFFILYSSHFLEKLHLGLFL